MENKFTFDNLSDELKAKLMECKTPDELKEVLAEAGMDLDEDVLKSIAGGLDSADMLADNCHRYKVECLYYKYLTAGICKHDFCQDICRVDENHPFCPSNCPTKSHV